MTRQEHLLTCLAEECMEVAQRITKTLRFGLTEIQQGQNLNNSERILSEFRDLLAVAQICNDEGILPPVYVRQSDVDMKRHKIERYMEISRKQGVLQ